MHEASPELTELFRRFEPLPDRVVRNRRRLWFFLALYVTLSSLLVAVSVVAGVYLTLLFFTIRLREEALLEALVWLTPRAPALVVLVWVVCAPLFTIWCAWTLGKGEWALLSVLRALPAATGQHRAAKSALHDVTIASGVKLPRLAVIDDDALNAFVVMHQPERAWVGVTTGLMDRLNEHELRCVLAHLAARIQDGSARTSTVMAELFAAASTSAGIGDHFVRIWEDDTGDGLITSLGKTAAWPLVVLYTITRWCLSVSALAIRSGYQQHQATTAEYADSAGMLFTRDPGAMIGALEKVLPADNRPGAAGEPRFREDIFGALFFAWPTFSFADDPELQRIRRMREVLGPAAMRADS